MNYLNSLQESLHGPKKKLLLFLERIERLRGERGLGYSQIEILDVGCGNGRQMTLPIGEQGYSVVGVDFHKPSIEYAQKINTLKNVVFIYQDVEKGFPFSDHKFDVVILSDILEHLKEPEKLLLNIRSVLKREAIVLISIPNGFGPYEIEDYLCRKGLLKPVAEIINFIDRGFRSPNRSSKRANDIPYNSECGHIQFFSMDRFKELIYLSGYEITAFRKGCLMGSALTGRLLSRSYFLTRLNVNIGEYLPYFACSVWYFECKAKNGQ